MNHLCAGEAMRTVVARYGVIFGVLGLMGCPPVENNSKEPDQGQQDMGDVQPDMTVTNDMTVEDAGADMLPKEDLGVDEDAGADMLATKVVCESMELSVKTSPADRPLEQFVWKLACNQEVDAARVSMRRAGSDQAPSCAEWECVKVPEGGVVCTCECSEGLVAPPPSGEGDAVAAERLELHVDGEPVSATVLRWGLSASEVAAQQERGSVMLPQGFEEFGLDVDIRVLDGGVFGFSSMLDETGSVINLSLFRVGEESGVIELNYDMMIEDEHIGAQDLEVMRLPSGGAEALLWAYDTDAQKIMGVAIQVDSTGQVVSQKRYEMALADHNLGPLQKVLDVRGMGNRRLADEGDTMIDGVSVLILAVQNDSIVLIEPFAQDSGDVVTLRTDNLFGRTAQEISSETFGFVKQPGHTEDIYDDGNDEYFYVWSADLSSPGEVEVSFIPTHTGVPSTRTYTAAGEVDSVRVDQLSQGELGVTIVYKNGPPTYVLPESLDTPSDRPFIEPSSNVNPLFGSGVGAGGMTPPPPSALPGTLWNGAAPPVFSQVGEQIQMYGRWPWNWRELKSARDQDVSFVRMAWDATSYAPLGMAPLVEEPFDTSTLQAGAPLLIGKSAHPGRVSLHQQQLIDATWCETDPERCSVFWSGEGSSPAITAGPGMDGLEFRIDGDVLPGDVKVSGSPVVVTHPDGSMDVLAQVNDERSTHALWRVDADAMWRGPAMISFVDARGERALSSSTTMHQLAMASEAHLVALIERDPNAFELVMIRHADLLGALDASDAHQIAIERALALPALPERAGELGLEPQVALLGFGDRHVLREDVPMERGDLWGETIEDKEGQLILGHLVDDGGCGALVMSALDAKQGVLTEVARQPAGDECVDAYEIEAVTRSADAERLVLRHYSRRNERTSVMRQKRGDGEVLWWSMSHTSQLLNLEASQLQGDPLHGDLNGDGLADLIVDATLDSEETVRLIYFANGFGGYLAEPVSVMGHPGNWWVSDSEHGLRQVGGDAPQSGVSGLRLRVRGGKSARIKERRVYAGKKSSDGGGTDLAKAKNRRVTFLLLK